MVCLRIRMPAKLECQRTKFYHQSDSYYFTITCADTNEHIFFASLNGTRHRADVVATQQADWCECASISATLTQCWQAIEQTSADQKVSKWKKKDSMWVPRWLNNVFLTYKYQLQEYIYLRRKLDDQCRCVKEVKSPTRAEITKTGQYKRNILVIF